MNKFVKFQILIFNFFRIICLEALRHIGALLLLLSCVKPLLVASKHPSFKKFDKFFPMFMKVRDDILNL